MGNPPPLHLESLRIRDVTVTTGLVDTYSTPTLLRLVASHQIDASRFVTHNFALDDIEEAYDVFQRPSETGAVKVTMSRWAPDSRSYAVTGRRGEPTLPPWIMAPA